MEGGESQASGTSPRQIKRVRTGKKSSEDAPGACRSGLDPSKRDGGSARECTCWRIERCWFLRVGGSVERGRQEGMADKQACQHHDDEPHPINMRSCLPTPIHLVDAAQEAFLDVRALRLLLDCAAAFAAAADVYPVPYLSLRLLQSQLRRHLLGSRRALVVGSL